MLFITQFLDTQEILIFVLILLFASYTQTINYMELKNMKKKKNNMKVEYEITE